MYCPNCANQIETNQKFCRACGANVSLVPQALTGQLPVTMTDDSDLSLHGRRKRRRRKEATIEGAIGKFFSGIGFLLAALFVTFKFPGGFTWGWSFLFPAFALIGEGIGQYVKVKQMERDRARAFAPPMVPTSFPQSVPPQPRVAELSAPTTSELVSPPSSISEHTTKHLNRQ